MAPKIWVWIAMALLILIAICIYSPTFDSIDLLIYGAAVVLAAAIAIPYAYLQSKRSEPPREWPSTYIDPTTIPRRMDTVHGYGGNRLSVLRGRIVWFLVITGCAALVVLVTIHSSEMKQLEKPLHRTRVHKIRSVNGDPSSDIVVSELWLCTDERNREYRLIDSPSDGYFPDDADGLVDSVSSRPFAYRRKDLKQWQPRPFEQVLYEVLTEKYIEAIAETMYSESSGQISDIRGPYRNKDSKRYSYITQRDRRKYRNMVIGFAVFAAILVVLDFFRRKCPACGRNWGLKRTGGRSNLNAGRFGRFRLPTSPDYTYEYRCSGCGHHEWIRFSINPFDRT